MKKKNIIPSLLWLAVVLIGVILVSSNLTARTTTGASSSTNEQISLTTDPNPLRLGPTNFIISVKDEQGNLVDNASVSFDLNMTTMNMGTQQGAAISQGGGRYVAAGRLTMSGPWRVVTKITMPGGQVINKNFEVNVR